MADFDKIFLSTLSLRRATTIDTASKNRYLHFYPRSPCGERRYLINTYHRIFGISIHALLAESDLRVVDGSKSSIISIHALLAESDTASTGDYLTANISIHALLAESD